MAGTLAAVPHEGPGQRRTPDLLAEADQLGLVSARERRTGGVRACSIGSSGAASVVLVGKHPVGYAREASGTGGADSLAREATVLTRLADTGLVPRPLALTTRSWTAPVPGATFGGMSRERPTLADLVPLAQRWGRALARLHTVPPARREQAASRPWVLDRGDPRLRGLDTASAAVRRALTNDPALVHASARAADRWAETVLIHGDLQAGHVVVEPGPQGAVRFLDLTRSGLGDPSWDVAVSLETLAWRSEEWRISEAVLADYFWAGYQRGHGPGHVDPEWRALAAVEVAWRHSAAGGSGTARTLDRLASWLGRAHAFADRLPHAWAA